MKLFCSKFILSNFQSQNVELLSNFSNEPSFENNHWIELKSTPINPIVVFFNEIKYWGYPSKEASIKAVHSEILSSKVRVESVISNTNNQVEEELKDFKAFRSVLAGLKYAFAWSLKFGLDDSVLNLFKNIRAKNGFVYSYTFAFIQNSDYPVWDHENPKVAMMESDIKRQLRAGAKFGKWKFSMKESISSLSLQNLDVDFIKENIELFNSNELALAISLIAHNKGYSIQSWVNEQEWILSYPEIVTTAFYLFGLKYSPSLFITSLPEFENDFLKLELLAWEITSGEKMPFQMRLKMPNRIEDEQILNKRFEDYYKSLLGVSKLRFLKEEQWKFGQDKNVFFQYKVGRNFENHFIKVQESATQLKNIQFAVDSKALQKISKSKVGLVLINNNSNLLKWFGKLISSFTHIDRLLFLQIESFNYEQGDSVTSGNMDDTQAFSIRNLFLKSNTYVDVFTINYSSRFSAIEFGRKFFTDYSIQDSFFMDLTYGSEDWKFEIGIRSFKNIAPFDPSMKYLFFNLK